MGTTGGVAAWVSLILIHVILLPIIFSRPNVNQQKGSYEAMIHYRQSSEVISGEYYLFCYCRLIFDYLYTSRHLRRE